MKSKSSLKDYNPAAGDQLVRRRGVNYIINKLNPRRKRKQTAPTRKKMS